ncbi:pre-mRNA-splicing factor CWC25 homolog [Ixodes scapularis]
MGGGDLNLKKSWHPSTLRNIERVWKAEQMRDQERAKIEQLQKELEEERSKQEMRQYAENKGVVKKRQERLDWMYQGVAGLVDRDQYLLGRKVDKNFEMLKKEEDGVKEENPDQQPGALFTVATTSATVDLENKIREDPLFAIKKQEMKTKKTLLSNPVKMKHLRDMIEQSLEKKKKKKKKKRKKERRSSTSSSDSSPRRKHRKHHSEARTRRTESSDEEVEEKRPKPINMPHGFGLLVRGKQPAERPRQEKPARPIQRQEKSQSPPHRHRRRPLSEREKEEARRQMMDNAQWRDEQRKTIISQCDRNEAKKGSGHGFLRPLLSQAADSGSVHGRIKQKMNRVQRGSDAMDTHFARK